MKEKLKGFFSILMILLLLPYVCTILFTGSMERKKDTNNNQNQIMIQVKYDGIVKEMDIEEYLVGMIPMIMPITYEKEALKAQAIICRTSILKRLEEEKDEEEVVFEEPFVTFEKMNTIMTKEEAAKSYEKLVAAVVETEGLVGLVDNDLVELPYHALSAGNTRVGEEVFYSSEYAYILGVESGKDIEGTNYLSVKTFTIEQIIEMCKEEYPHLKIEENVDIITVEQVGSQAEIENIIEFESQEKFLNHQIYIETKDSAGYAMQVRVGNVTIQGEKFRSLLGLNSSNMEFLIAEEKIQISVKGLGHGVGLSQYGANIWAKEGRNYKEILEYYFGGLELEKKVIFVK
jgi:SpoIID/LytB domain